MSATTRADSARALRTLAKRVEQSHPLEATPAHLRDAAQAVERGNHEGARRHLIAAMHTFEPRMLLRVGVMNDSGHARAKQDLGMVHRQFLKIRDIQDQEDKAEGQREARRAANGQAAGGSPVVPARPVPAPEPAQLANTVDLVGPGGWSHGWIRADAGLAAASLHRKPVIGRTASGNQVRGVYDHNIRKVVTKNAGAISVTHLMPDMKGSPPPFLNTPAMRTGEAAFGRGSLGAALKAEGRPPRKWAGGMSNEVDLAFNPAELRDPGGKWAFGGSSGLKAPGPPGSFEHARWMDRVAETISQPEVRNAVHQATRAMIGRDLKTAHQHMANAIEIDQLMAGGKHVGDLRKVDSSLNAVPRHAAIRNRARNPLERESQHPGRYVESHLVSEPRTSMRYRAPNALIAGGYSNPTTAEQMEIAAIGLAMTDDEVAVLLRDEWLDLSAQTEALASVHRPFGKPGGPGLWNVKGMQLPAYIQNIARALLRTGRARDLSHAIAIARAATKRWAHGGGKVHPEVRAASAATGAEWEAGRARAHAHAGEPPHVIELFNPYHAPPGTGGGQFTSKSGGGAAAAKDKRGDRAQRQQLVHKIAGLRNQIAALQAMLPKAPKATRATKAAKPVSAKAAAAAAARKAKAGATPRKKGVAAHKMTPATIHAKIAALRATLRADIAQLRSIH